MFTIVYPEKSVKAAIYPAVTLQYLFWKKGITLPLSTEESAGDAVVIRECEGMEKGSFTAVTEGKRLVVSAGDMFGFIAASDYLTRDLFADAEAVIPAVSHTGRYQMEMHDEKKGNFRVMYHNVWFHDVFGPAKNIYGITDALYELAEIMTHRPDVVGFNEFVDTWRNDTDIIEMLRLCGYEEAKPVNIQKNMIVPLFYNTKTVKPVDNSCHMLSYGEAILDENYKTLLPPQKRYYKPAFTRYRAAVACVFEELATGKRFGACVTHIESNHYCPHQQPDEGDELRREEVNLLIPFLQLFSRKYGVSFSVGGDYNSVVTRMACTTLEDAGFQNARDLAAEKNDVCSCHGYPVYCKELDTYPDYFCGFAENPNPVGGYSHAIDQIYTIGDIDVKSYFCLYEKTILCSSDHSPVMIDFNV